MPDKEKLKKLVQELQRLKIVAKDGEMAGVIYDLSTKLSLAKGEQGIQGEKGEKGERGEQGLKGSDGKDGRNGSDGKDGKNGKDGRDGHDGIDGREGEKGLQGLNGADGSSDNGKMIVAKLENLNKEEKLSIMAIKDLEDELKKLKKQISQKTIGVAGPTGGHVVKAHDLSDSLNGQTKTFSLPAFWRIISVVSSSFPTAFRLTTDYTVDGSLFKITFTSAIDAGTTLAAGQTIIVTFSE